jgi:23S rRNA (guanosine2251-2'-O)-methyltransferase
MPGEPEKFIPNNVEHNKEQTNFIFGIRPVIEAIKAGKEVDKLLIQNGLQGELVSELRSLIKQHNIVFQFVPPERMRKYTTKNHQGIIAFISEIEYHRVENLVPQLFEQGKNPLLLLLDRVTDVRNFGAICRTAECAGVDAVIIPARGSAQIGSDAIKTSAGALHKLPVCKEDNLKVTLLYLKESGIKIVGCTEKTTSLYTAINLKEPVCIVMGSEENGISPEYLKLCDEKAKLPLLGEIESLNVSVAAGVFLYEAIRQRSA